MCGPSAVPAGLGEDYAGIEATVAGIAAQHTAADLRTILEVIIQQYRPEVHDDLAEHDRARRRVDLSPGLDNTGSSTGCWTPPPVKRWPRRSTCTPHRPARMTPAARGSAAPTPGEIAGRAADTTDRPTGTGHVTITVTPDQLNTGLGCAGPRGC